jgi:hypothetical protein
MEHLDRLIPPAILGVVAAFVLFLLRRTARDKDVTAGSAETPAPIPIAQPIVVAVPVAEIKRARQKRRTRTPAVVPIAPVKTPIHTVLGLLKEKDTLAAAFLLREILAPPVSKRVP